MFGEDAKLLLLLMMDVNGAQLRQVSLYLPEDKLHHPVQVFYSVHNGERLFQIQWRKSFYVLPVAYQNNGILHYRMLFLMNRHLCLRC